MEKSVDILIKSGFLAGKCSKSIQLTSLGKQLKDVVSNLVTNTDSKVSETTISNQIRCPKTKYLETFFKIQRERKIWWMKYSSNPGRLRFSDFIQTEGENRKVSICSDFEFGALAIESLEVRPVDETDVVIQSTVSLDQAVMGILIDASEGSDRMRLHRHLAPYQVSLLHRSEDIQTSLLRDHLFQTLNKSGIRLDPSANGFQNEDLEEMVLAKDRIGIPFDIIIDEESLKFGLLKLRSRDTTISEIVHISSLPEYLIKILNTF